jgi:hypothetical protein
MFSALKNFFAPAIPSFDEMSLAKVGDVVLYIQCDGCMASEHNLKWVGIVVKMQDTRVYNGNRNGEPCTLVTCEVVKNGNQDWRDAPLGYRTFIREDKSFQRLGPNLIVGFK